MTSDVFDFEGAVGFGYVLFALALSLAIGVVSRRTAPAVIGGFIGYAVVSALRPGRLRPNATRRPSPHLAGRETRSRGPNLRRPGS